MGACGCGYTTDPEKNCNGTHRVVQAVKTDIAQALAAQGLAEAAEVVKEFKKYDADPGKLFRTYKGVESKTGKVR